MRDRCVVLVCLAVGSAAASASDEGGPLSRLLVSLPAVSQPSAQARTTLPIRARPCHTHTLSPSLHLSLLSQESTFASLFSLRLWVECLLVWVLTSSA